MFRYALMTCKHKGLVTQGQGQCQEHEPQEQGPGQGLQNVSLRILKVKDMSSRTPSHIIVHHSSPLPTHQISFESGELFVDEHQDWLY